MSNNQLNDYQEIVDSEINSIMIQRDKLKDDLDQIKSKGDRLNELHAKRDEILGEYYA